MWKAHKILRLYLGFAAVHQHTHPCWTVAYSFTQTGWPCPASAGRRQSQLAASITLSLRQLSKVVMTQCRHCRSVCSLTNYFILLLQSQKCSIQTKDKQEAGGRHVSCGCCFRSTIFLRNDCECPCAPSAMITEQRWPGVLCSGSKGPGNDTASFYCSTYKFVYVMTCATSIQSKNHRKEK